MAYKIAIIGSEDTISGFKALGVQAVAANDAVETQNKIKAMYEKNEFAVIFITEDWADKISDFLENLAPKALPAIVSIPSQKGTTGAGLRGIRKIVEKAVGSDIFSES